LKNNENVGKVRGSSVEIHPDGHIFALGLEDGNI
jgi:hypothetical protein